MWIVRLALRRTYTFVVMALLMVAVSLVAINRMCTDIFPEINIPVVSVVWQYTGMPADEIEQRIILINERVLTTSVNDIEHIESQSLFGVGVIRIYFYPSAKIEAAVAQVTATSQAILKVMPPGIDPPYIVQYSATSVPIVQIAVSSDTLTEQQIFDYAANFIIQRLGIVQGARVPQPWGGKWPQVMVDLDPDAALRPRPLAAGRADRHQQPEPDRPAGTAKIGDTEYYVKLNSSPQMIAAFNDMPVKTVNGVPIYVKDVANVHMGYAGADQRRPPRRPPRRADDDPQGRRAPRSLDVVNRVREALPGIQAQMPPELKMELLFDQSVFVRAAVDGVIKEGAIAAGLTALMILIFLGSWRSTLIVAVSIPLSILTSIIVPLGAGAVAQHHDAGRHGAGGRRSRGRRDRGAGEHPPQLRLQQADPPGDPRRGVADRHAGVRLDPGDLHRLRAGAVPDGPGGVAVLPAGAGGRLRHAHFVFAVADAGADDGALPVADRSPALHRPGAGRDGRRPDLAVSPPLRPPVRALAHRPTRGCSAGRSSTAS